MKQHYLHMFGSQYFSYPMNSLYRFGLTSVSVCFKL